MLAIWPGAFFSEQNAERRFQFPDTQYFSGEIAIPGVLFLGTVLLIFIWLIVLYARNRAQLDEDSQGPMVMLLIWFVCGINDMAIAIKAYDGPMLIVVGYSGFLMGFSAILTRRMTASMDELEQSAQQLQELVEERTDALRESERQLQVGGRGRRRQVDQAHLPARSFFIQ